MTVTPQTEVSELFLRFAREMREIGCTRLEAFGVVACFGPVVVPDAPRKPEDQRKLTPEAQELASRADKWLGSGR